MLPRTLGLALLAALALAAPAEAAGWLEPELPFGQTAFQPDEAAVAMGPDGTIVLARVAAGGDVEVRERPPGGPIGDTVTLEPVTAPPAASSVQVLVGDYGTAAVLFDSGAARYAALRSPGGRWSRPEIVSLAGTRQAAVAPDGALWVAGADPGDRDALGVSRMTPDGQTKLTPLPAPPDGARDVFPMITAPYPGGAHVTFEREITEARDGACRRHEIEFAIDVPARGEPDVPQTLADFHAAGTGTAGACVAHDGLISTPPLLATDDDGADTAVYTVENVHAGVLTTLARRRERGEAWGQTEAVTIQDVVAETLIGGRGAPTVVLRTGERESVTTRGAGGAWTPPAPLAPTAPLGARTGTGTIVFAWADSAHVLARVLGPDGALGDVETLADADPDSAVLGVGGDDDGDAVALYSQPGNRLQLSRYDAGREIAAPSPVPPALPAPAIPPPERHPPHLTHVALDPRHPRANRAPALTLRTDVAGELRVTLRHGRRTLHARGLIRAGKVRLKLPRLSAGTWTLTAVEQSVSGDASATARLRVSVRRAARPRP